MSTGQDHEQRLYIMAAGALMAGLIVFGIMNTFGVFR